MTSVRVLVIQRLSIALIALTPASLAGTLYVDASLTTGLDDGSSWGDAYQGSDGLQDALAAAQAGDRVFVAQGSYLASASGDRAASFVMSSGVEIYGSFLGTESSPNQRSVFGSAPSVLSGDLAGNDTGMSGSIAENSLHLVISQDVDATAVLDGFTVSAAVANMLSANNDGAGLRCGDGQGPTIRNCRFVDCFTTGSGAGVAVRTSSPVFLDCIFEGNHADLGGGGLDVRDSAVRVDRCVFVGNDAFGGGGMSLSESSASVVTSCVIRGNTSTGSGGGLFVAFGTPAVLGRRLSITSRPVIWRVVCASGSARQLPHLQIVSSGTIRDRVEGRGRSTRSP